MDQATLNSLLLGGALAAGVWVIRLLASLLLAIIPAVAVGIFKHKLTSTFQMKEHEPGLLLLTGFFSSLLAAAITLLFAVSIIGIPLALLIIILAAYAFLRGMTEISFLVGSRIRDADGKEPWKITALGAALLTAGMNVPLFGALLFLGLLWASLGITTLKLWRKVKKRS
ncbi:MAG: hypothetical protein A2189_03470 [Paenibacillus sp. RIFOXYA1_FULL_44_5]|nr:MAG: hypothetical protein A2189_03470 [Paenibacillus sp. RIFOXYA1_FULL_44_5]